MSASPHTFCGLPKRAKDCYLRALERTRETDKEGFSQLVSWETIREEIVNLSHMQGVLEEKIRDLDKNSKKKPDYEELYQKITVLRKELEGRHKRRI